MSGRARKGGRLARAPMFAALGDETRLLLVRKLCGGEARSITELTEGSKLTRQAMTKHLRVLEKVGIVRCVRSGRESLFELDPRPIEAMKEYLGFVSEQWERALERLRAFVEE